MDQVEVRSSSWTLIIGKASLSSGRGSSSAVFHKNKAEPKLNSESKYSIHVNGIMSAIMLFIINPSITPVFK